MFQLRMSFGCERKSISRYVAAHGPWHQTWHLGLETGTRKSLALRGCRVLPGRPRWVVLVEAAIREYVMFPTARQSIGCSNGVYISQLGLCECKCRCRLTRSDARIGTVRGHGLYRKDGNWKRRRKYEEEAQGS